ncbi:hypothetical protein, partial [Mesorhizobium sp. M2E.F.Ca.ET.154.01.1.1]|uniref:hypothetical protein n=1 Tax=Mesorhizobium sp. M2E.F.Ca.ET.154.01.1.1 TaxID=2500521 RepID=UPI001AEE19AB
VDSGYIKADELTNASLKEGVLRDAGPLFVQKRPRYCFLPVSAAPCAVAARTGLQHVDFAHDTFR